MLRKDIAVALLQSAQKRGDEFIIEIPVGDTGQITELPKATIRNEDMGKEKVTPSTLFLQDAPTILTHLAQTYGIHLEPGSEDEMNVYFSGDSKENAQAILGRDLDNILDPARKSTIYTIEDMAAVEAAADMSWETAQARKPRAERPGGEKQM